MTAYKDHYVKLPIRQSGGGDPPLGAPWPGPLRSTVPDKQASQFWPKFFTFVLSVVAFLGMLFTILAVLLSVGCVPASSACSDCCRKCWHVTVDRACGGRVTRDEAALCGHCRPPENAKMAEPDRQTGRSAGPSACPVQHRNSLACKELAI